MAAEIGDGSGRGALVFVEDGGLEGSRGATEIGGDDAVVFEDDGAFGAGDFDATGVAGVGGSGGLKNAEGAAGEFQDGRGGVFGFDLVQQGGGAGLDASDITEKPEEQVNRVDALIDERSAAVERECAAPAGVGIVLWRAIPLHASVDYKGPAEEALVEPGFELADVRLQAVLKNDAEFYLGLFRSFNEGVRARGADFDRLLRKDVQAVTGGGNALRGVEAGGTADNDEIHGAMIEEGFEIWVGRGAVLAGETGDFFGIGSVDGGDFDAGDGPGGAGVGFRDVAAAD